MTIDPLSSSPAGETFSEALRRRNADVWDAMVRHRFVQDILDDRLPDAVFRRYLRYEHSFVETAVKVFAHALVKAETADQQRRLVTVLHGLVFDQTVYFEGVFRDMGMEPASKGATTLPPGAKALSDGALSLAANGGFPEILAGMLAAEWAYETWCTEAALRAVGSPQLRTWVELHVGGAFSEQVTWLRAEVDAAGRSASPSGRAAMEAAFRRTLELELPFHEAPYG